MMSEQEKKSGSNIGVSPVAMVEQSQESRHKQPYRPIELQEETPDQHHKRSRAPAVPSVTEDIKKLSEDTPVSDTVEIKDRKEVDNVISPEKYKKPSVARNLSSSIKRREPAAERIPLATMEVEVRKGTLTPPPQPIPATVKTLSASDLKVKDIDEKQEEKKTEETDSITEEISELPTAKAKYSEWNNENFQENLQEDETVTNRNTEVTVERVQTNLDIAKNKNLASSSYIKNKREVSWDSDDYLQKMNLKECRAKSQAVLLERKASVGPCRSRTLYEKPSGITLCVPKKSTIKIDSRDQSGINISISKRNVMKHSAMDKQKCEDNGGTRETRAVRVDPDIPYIRIIGALREKYDVMRSRLKNVLHI